MDSRTNQYGLSLHTSRGRELLRTRVSQVRWVFMCSALLPCPQRHHAEGKPLPLGNPSPGKDVDSELDRRPGISSHSRLPPDLGRNLRNCPFYTSGCGNRDQMPHLLK
jgi:hypothetical protein